MKTIDRARIDPAGRYLVGITKNRIVRHTFVANTKGLLTTTPAWEQRLSHASGVVIGSRAVIVTNTAGDHLAIDAESGHVLWKDSAAPGRCEPRSILRSSR